MKPKPIYVMGIRVFGYTVLGTVLCFLVLFFLGGLTEYTLGLVLIQFCNLFIYIPLLYSPMWLEGDKNNNMVQFGRMEEDLKRGFKIGAIAAIPSALVSILLLLSKAGLFYDFLVIYKIIAAQILPGLNLFTGTTSYITDLSWAAIIVLSLLPVFIPVFCGVGYVLGYKRIAIMQKIVYKDSKKASRAKDKRLR